MRRKQIGRGASPRVNRCPSDFDFDLVDLVVVEVDLPSIVAAVEAETLGQRGFSQQTKVMVGLRKFQWA